MATLGKVLQRYIPLFEERGFRKQTPRHRGPFFKDSAGRYVSYDSVKGGANIRCFLGICPTTANTSQPEIEAESRWWRTQYDSSLESAVASSWEYILKSGFSFLDSPLSLTPTQWREQFGLLVRDFRLRSVVVSWPTDWHLNDVVIRSKRCIPEFAALSAIEVHRRLEHQRQLAFTCIPLANALELQQAIETHGFSVAIHAT